MTDNPFDAIAEMGVVHPGDTVILRLNRSISLLELQEYTSRFEAAVPGVRLVCIEAEQALIVKRGELGSDV